MRVFDGTVTARTMWSIVSDLKKKKKNVFSSFSSPPTRPLLGGSGTPSVPGSSRGPRGRGSPLSHNLAAWLRRSSGADGERPCRRALRARHAWSGTGSVNVCQAGGKGVRVCRADAVRSEGRGSHSSSPSADDWGGAGSGRAPDSPCGRTQTGTCCAGRPARGDGSVMPTPRSCSDGTNTRGAVCHFGKAG